MEHEQLHRELRTLMDILQREYAENLDIQGQNVAWDKALLLILRDLDFDLKLEDHATRVFLYKGDECLGEVPYEVTEMAPDDEFSAPYEVMYLDLLALNPADEA